MKIKNNISILNVVSNLLLQLFSIISGFIIPRLILSYFGSEVNGLISSLSQLLNYITLLEGGVTSVIMANLYKPLYDKDMNKVSSIVVTTRSFFKKIALLYCFYALILAIVYPFIFNTNFSFIYIFSLTIILAINLFVQYNYSLSLKLLLNADKKVYIVSFVQILIIILTIVLSIVSLNIYPKIHFLKFVTVICYFIQPIFYNFYVKKHYKLDHKVKQNKNLIKSRWDGFAINIAAFMHFNTDSVILSLFTNLKIVSVYSVYTLVSSGLRQIIMSISSAISPSIGRLYAKGNTKDLNQRFDLYELIMFVLVFFAFTVAGLLITPFVMLYTKNVNDINYYEPMFGTILLVAEAIYLIKEPHLNLAYSANKFKKLKKHAYIEAIINALFSILLVKKYKLLGVAIGTLLAMTYRTIVQVFFLKKDILYRSVNKFFKKLLIFGVVSCFGIFICKFFVPFENITVFNWIIYALIYSLIIGTIILFILFIFFRKELKQLFKYFK